MCCGEGWVGEVKGKGEEEERRGREGNRGKGEEDKQEERRDEGRVRVEDGWMDYAGGCDGGGGVDGLTGLPESPPLQKPGRQAAQSLLLVSATAPEDNSWPPE